MFKQSSRQTEDTRVENYQDENESYQEQEGKKQIEKLETESNITIII